MSFFKKNQPSAEVSAQQPELETSQDFTDPRLEFRITVDTQHVDDLYAALEHSYEDDPIVFSKVLERPVQKASLMASRDDKSFLLYGMVELESEKMVEPVFNLIQTSLRLLDEDVKLRELSGSFIVQNDDARILVAKGGSYSDRNQIIVSTGKIRTGYHSYSEAFSAPESSIESFRTHMEHIIGGMTLAMALAYDESRHTIEPETIQLTMPRQKTRLPDFGSFDQPKTSKTPEDISKQFGVEFPKVTFDEIGGQVKAKEEIQGLAFAITHPEVYAKWGTRPPKGILLHGPPGTGKTLLAKALASEANAAFYAITPSDITAKWYGESERKVKEIFEVAQKQEKAIIYFDELDAIIPRRDGGAHEATQRVVSTILQYLDGVKSSDSVMVVASTNRKDAIDAAMLRPGRLDRLVEVELPNESDRSEIFSIHAMRAEHLAGRVLFEDSVDYSELALQTEGFSGADIAEIVRRTLEMKVRTEAYGLEPSNVDVSDIRHEIEQYERNRPKPTND